MASTIDIESQIPLLEEILGEWRDLIGQDFAGYRNHVYRMVHFCFALRDCTQEEREKILIAGAFHDLGIWVENTVDYIPPSLPPMADYLERRGLENWSEEIRLMISEHHKVGEFKDERFPLVEVFRRGDLVDFSFGVKRFGIPKECIAEVKNTFPNAGFHKGLGKRWVRWFVKHPLNPLPMMKW